MTLTPKPDAAQSPLQEHLREHLRAMRLNDGRLSARAWPLAVELGEQAADRIDALEKALQRCVDDDSQHDAYKCDPGECARCDASALLAPAAPKAPKPAREPSVDPYVASCIESAYLEGWGDRDAQTEHRLPHGARVKGWETSAARYLLSHPPQPTCKPRAPAQSGGRS